MIQETHFQVRYIPKFLHSHFPNFYMVSAANKSKGVAVLNCKTCNFTWIADTKDPEGRFILVKGTIEGHLYSLISYYTPNKGQAAFFKHLFETFAPLFEGTVIFGGDANAAFDQGLDRTKPPSAQLTRPTKESLKIAKLIHAQGFTDVWRELNPTKLDYMHFSHPHNSYARIDHLFRITLSNLL